MIYDEDGDKIVSMFVTEPPFVASPYNRTGDAKAYVSDDGSASDVYYDNTFIASRASLSPTGTEFDVSGVTYRVGAYQETVGLIDFYIVEREDDDRDVINITKTYMSFDGQTGDELIDFRPETAMIELDGTTATLTEPIGATADVRFLGHDTTLESQTPAQRDAADAFDTTTTSDEYVAYYNSDSGSQSYLISNGFARQWWFEGTLLATHTSTPFPTTLPGVTFYREGAQQGQVSGFDTWSIEREEEVSTTVTTPAVTEIPTAPNVLCTGVPSDFFEDTDVSFRMTSSNNYSIIVNGTTTTVSESGNTVDVAGFTFDVTAFRADDEPFTQAIWTFAFNIDSTTQVINLGAERQIEGSNWINVNFGPLSTLTYDSTTVGFVTTDTIGDYVYPNTPNSGSSTRGSFDSHVYRIGAFFNAGDRGIIQGYTQAGLVDDAGDPLTELGEITSADPDISEDQDGVLTLDNGVFQNMNGEHTESFDDQEMSYNVATPLTQTSIRNVDPNLVDSDTFILELTDGVVQDTTSTTLSGITDGDEIKFDTIE